MAVDAVRLNFENGGLGLLNVLIGLVMFGVALNLHVSDFLRIAANPKGPLIGVIAQFLLMPAASFLLTLILAPSPSIALGMILIAACPGGNLSNFLTVLSKGNPAMSVTMTAISTVIAVFMTPLNLAFWGSLNPSTAELLREIQLDPINLFQTILVILGVPTLLGMAVVRFAPVTARRLHHPFRYFSIVAFLTFVVMAFVGNWDVFLGYIHWVLLAVFLQNSAALATGYTASCAAGLPEADRRAIAIEVGIQNSALGLILVFRYFDGLGGMALVAGWWGIWHIISGLTLATFWARRPPAPIAENPLP